MDKCGWFVRVGWVDSRVSGWMRILLFHSHLHPSEFVVALLYSHPAIALQRLIQRLFRNAKKSEYARLNDQV